MPGNSRIGCVNEYRIFCAFLIRNLINKKNWPINEAWGAICNGKPKLPKDVFGFKNLDRYCKVLAGRCGGLRDYCLGGGYSNPIAEIDIPSTCASPQLFNGVGWIICERDPMKPVA
ncbi:hypothetical protein IKG06_03285 [Candidatus Saccharibacteria bacterium]|nr:hypothetical protein [Candidatus Saccharibacteria bacterium]